MYLSVFMNIYNIMIQLTTNTQLDSAWILFNTAALAPYARMRAGSLRARKYRLQLFACGGVSTLLSHDTVLRAV